MTYLNVCMPTTVLRGRASVVARFGIITPSYCYEGVLGDSTVGYAWQGGSVYSWRHSRWLGTETSTMVLAMLENSNRKISIFTALTPSIPIIQI